MAPFFFICILKSSRERDSEESGCSIVNFKFGSALLNLWKMLIASSREYVIIKMSSIYLVKRR